MNPIIVTAAGITILAPIWAKITEAPAPPGPALVAVPDSVCHGDFAEPVARDQILEPIPCSAMRDPHVAFDQWQLYLAGVLNEGDLSQEYPGVMITATWDAEQGRTVLGWTTERRECQAGRLTRCTWRTPDPRQIWTHDLWGDGSDMRITVAPGTILTVEVISAAGLWSRSFAYSPCDLDLDGWHDSSDLVAYLAAPWDWNGDGVIDARDIADLVACISR